MLRNFLRTAFARPAVDVAVEAPPPRVAEPFVAFVTMVSSVQQCNPRESGFQALASTRLRVLIPAKALAATVPVVFVPVDYLLSDPALERIGSPRAIVSGQARYARSCRATEE